MEWFEALILGLLQGLTEYLPVSSSGHLAIGSGIDFWQDMDKRTEASQLLYCLKKYMCSDRFNPSSEVDAKDLSILSSAKNQK